MKYTQKKFFNGLNLFMLPLKDSESVVFTVLTKVGSRHEDPKQAGMAHFLEHLFFKGSKKYPTASQISETIDGIGGDWNAATGKETTEFYIRAGKNNFKLIIETLTDMLQNPLFDAAEIEREKGVIVEEIKMYRDNPHRAVEENLEKIMWPGTKFGDDIAGSEKTVRGITREDILAFWKKWYVPENIVIGIAGNFEQSEALKFVQKNWGVLPKSKKPKSVESISLATEPLKKPQFMLDHRDIEQVGLALGFRSFGHGDKRMPAVRILATLLGGGMSSRLFTNVRSNKGLAYTIYAGNDNYHGTGMFMVYAGLRSGSSQQAIIAIYEELQKVVEEKLTTQELARTKEQIKGRVALHLEDSQSKLDFILSSFINRGKVEQPEDVMRKIDAVSAEQVCDVAKTLFDPKNLAVAMIGPVPKNEEVMLRKLSLKGMKK